MGNSSLTSSTPFHCELNRLYFEEIRLTADARIRSAGDENVVSKLERKNFFSLASRNRKELITRIVHLNQRRSAPQESANLRRFFSLVVKAKIEAWGRKREIIRAVIPESVQTTIAFASTSIAMPQVA